MRGYRCLLVLCVVLTYGCGDRSSTVEPESTSPSPELNALIPESDLNRDWRTRDKILGIAVRWGQDDSGGIVSVDRIDLPTLQRLLSANFIDPNDQQNEAPTVAQIADFMGTHPGTYAFGYAVTPARPDYRVSLEGIAVPSELVTPAVRKAAEELCHDADESAFEPEIYCWWD